MSGLKLTLKKSPTRRLIADGLSADRLLGRSVREVEFTKLSWVEPSLDTGSTIGDWFRVETTSPATTTCVCIEGDLARFDRVAAFQSSGNLHVDGDVGDLLGCGMKGGIVIVGGNAGSRTAAAAPGSRTGMQGGRLEIQGDVGDELASRMRRGEVFIAGNAGDYVAGNLIAGTVMVAGSVGEQPAFGMRRGSLLLGEAHSMSVKGSQVSRFEGLVGRFSSPIPASKLWMRLVSRPHHAATVELIQRFGVENALVCRGDRAVGGQGEILWIA